MATPQYAVGDIVEMACGPVKIWDVRTSARMGVEYKCVRLTPEPVGYNRDGSIMVSVGLPFWTQAWLVRGLVESGASK